MDKDRRAFQEVADYRSHGLLDHLLGIAGGIVIFVIGVTARSFFKKKSSVVLRKTGQDGGA